MSDFQISIPGGQSKRLLTGGKYCPADIVVTAEEGGSAPVEVDLLTAENLFGDGAHYMTTTGAIANSSSWTTYAVKPEYVKLVFKGYTTSWSPTVPSVGFYSSESPSESTFISGITREPTASLLEITVTEDDIPAGTKLILFSSRTASGSGTSLVGTIKTPNAAVTPQDVNFYDYDGTLLYAYTVEEVQALTKLPPLPAHEGLVSQAWSWSLADLKALGRDMDVMPYFATTDGATRLYIENDTGRDMTVTLYLTQTAANGCTVCLDEENCIFAGPDSGTGEFTVSHTYGQGKFVIAIEGAFGFASASGKSALGSDIPVARLLKHVRCGSNLSMIGDYAFQNCTGLETITIHNALPYIRAGAFCDCKALKALTVPPKHTTSIGYYMVKNCCSMKVLSLHKAVTGFSSNFGLRSIPRLCLHGAAKTLGALYDATALQTINIPSGTTSIPSTFLMRCESLSRVTVPATVTSIGTQAFANCTSLATLEFQSTTPPTVANANAFTGLPTSCVVKVPAASLATYKAATNYASIAAQMVGV